MWIIIFIMIIIVLLIVCLETWKRFSKKRDLHKKEMELDHAQKILEIEKKKMEMQKTELPKDLF